MSGRNRERWIGIFGALGTVAFCAGLAYLSCCELTGSTVGERVFGVVGLALLVLVLAVVGGVVAASYERPEKRIRRPSFSGLHVDLGGSLMSKDFHLQAEEADTGCADLLEYAVRGVANGKKDEGEGIRDEP